MGTLVEVLARLSVLTREAVGGHSWWKGWKCWLFPSLETYMTSPPKNGGFPSSESSGILGIQVLLLLVLGRVLGNCLELCRRIGPQDGRRRG